MLLLSAGRDCTDLFRQYHWWDLEKPRKFLNTYKIGIQVGETEFPVYSPDTRGFYETLSKRIRNYFETNKLHPKDPIPGIWRLVVILIVAFGLFALMNDVFVTLPLLAKLVVAIGYGIFQVRYWLIIICPWKYDFLRFFCIFSRPCLCCTLCMMLLILRLDQMRTIGSSLVV